MWVQENRGLQARTILQPVPPKRNQPQQPPRAAPGRPTATRALQRPEPGQTTLTLSEITPSQAEELASTPQGSQSPIEPCDTEMQ